MNDIRIISRLLDDHNPQEHPTLDFLVCSCGDHDFQNRSFNDHVALSLFNAGVRINDASCPSCGAAVSGCLACGWKPLQHIVALSPTNLPPIDSQDPERLDGWTKRLYGFYGTPKSFDWVPTHPSYLDTMMEPKKSPY